MNLPFARLLVAAAAVASVLVGCKTAGSGSMTASAGGPGSPKPKPTHDARPCPATSCEIRITVTGDCKDPKNITVDEDHRSTNGRIDFRWTISPESYAFTRDGIVVDDPDETKPGNSKQFKPKPPNPQHPNQFEIHDANERQNSDDPRDAYKYTINIQGCAPVDPWIRNE